MSLTTSEIQIAPKRKPKFDWDLARVMRSEGGLSYNEIARQMGVSVTAVQRVCDPKMYARLKAANLRFQRSGTCVDCGGQMSHNPAADKARAKLGIPPLQRCRDCWNIHNSIQSTKSARAETLLCSHCRKWLPDEEFRAGHVIGRRLRKNECMDCEVILRREYRQRTKLLDPEKHAAQVERHRLRAIARKQALRDAAAAARDASGDS